MINVQQVSSDFWKKEVQVATVEMGPTTELRISVVETKRGDVRLNVREWTQYRNGDFGPTKSGFTLNVESLDELAEAVAQAKAVVEEHFS